MLENPIPGSLVAWIPSSCLADADCRIPAGPAKACGRTDGDARLLPGIVQEGGSFSRQHRPITLMLRSLRRTPPQQRRRRVRGHELPHDKATLTFGATISAQTAVLKLPGRTVATDNYLENDNNV